MNEAHLDKLYQQVAEVVIYTIPEVVGQEVWSY